MLCDLISAHLCVTPDNPVNGYASCEEGDIGVLCVISCNKGFAFVSPPPTEYFCAYEHGAWLPEEKFPFPDCSGKKINRISVST